MRPTISSTNAACYYIRFCLTYETNKIESFVCSIVYVYRPLFSACLVNFSIEIWSRLIYEADVNIAWTLLLVRVKCILNIFNPAFPTLQLFRLFIITLLLPRNSKNRQAKRTFYSRISCFYLEKSSKSWIRYYGFVWVLIIVWRFINRRWNVFTYMLF